MVEVRMRLVACSETYPRTRAVHSCLKDVAFVHRRRVRSPVGRCTYSSPMRPFYWSTDKPEQGSTFLQFFMRFVQSGHPGKSSALWPNSLAINDLLIGRGSFQPPKRCRGLMRHLPRVARRSPEIKNDQFCIEHSIVPKSCP